MDDKMAIGLVIGFGFGMALTGGVFYILYLQVASELFDNISELKKIFGWLTVKLHGLAEEKDKDKN